LKTPHFSTLHFSNSSFFKLFIFQIPHFSNASFFLEFVKHVCFRDYPKKKDLEEV